MDKTPAKGQPVKTTSLLFYPWLTDKSWTFSGTQWISVLTL